jgi:MFS family permease
MLAALTPAGPSGPAERRCRPLLTHLVTTRVVPAEEADAYLRPRDDGVVGERADGVGCFAAASGPFEHYRRSVIVEPDGDGTAKVTQEIDFRLAIPFWRFLFIGPFRAMLGRPPGAPAPWWWWAPPDRLEPRESSVLAVLCTVAVVGGYLGTLMTQTITFAADEFGAEETAQGAALSSVRIGVLLALVVTALADRRGRRALLVAAATAGCLLAATGAAAPNLVWLTASQTLARGCSAALALLIGIVSAEEMPRNSRAYAFSLINMAAALGAGVCLWALPLADLDESGWRLLYVLPLAGLPLVWWVSRRLPETRRFAEAHVEAPLAGHGRRFWLLALTGFLLAAFAAPATQFQNEFLRDDRGFSAARISLFVISTTTPGGIGIIVGGRLADLRGRRLVAAVGIVGGTVFSVVMFSVAGWAMWLAAVIGTLVAALTVPALGVYRPELFPTSLRGRAAGSVEVIVVAGSASGLLLVGALAERWGSFAGPMALLSAPPLIAAVVILTAYPETAHRSLEELNPEDRHSADRP